MLIIYRDGEVQNQIVAWGADRERLIEGVNAFLLAENTANGFEELEAVLVLCGAIIPTTDRGPPGSRRDRDGEHSEEDSDDEPSSQMRSAGTRVNGKTSKNMRTKKAEGSDSELDM